MQCVVAATIKTDMNWMAELILARSEPAEVEPSRTVDTVALAALLQLSGTSVPFEMSAHGQRSRSGTRAPQRGVKQERDAACVRSAPATVVLREAVFCSATVGSVLL